jgi:hypothetical protein
MKVTIFDVFPSSLIDSNVNLKWKQRKNKELRARSLVRSILGVKGHVGVSGWDQEEWQALNHSQGPTQNQTTSWLVHNWSTFGAKTNHGQTQTHKTHHGPNLGEAITFPLIVYFVPSHGTSTQMSFCLGTPKWESRIPTTRTYGTLEAHNFACRP